MFIINVILLVNFTILIALLLTMKRKANQAKMGQNSKNTVHHYNELLENIKRQAQGEAITPVLTSTPLKMLITLISFYRTESEKQGIEFEVDLSELLCDEHVQKFHIIHIVGNLLENALEAIKASPLEHHNKIQLDIQCDQDSLNIEVYNTWPDEVKGVVDTDQWLKSGYSSKSGPGRGNGLAIVRKLVRDSDGLIHIDVDNGVRFIVEYTV